MINKLIDGCHCDITPKKRDRVLEECFAGGSGGVSVEEIKKAFPGGVGYSEVTETNSDTLTWDGNTDGLVGVEQASGGFYLVSTNAPTKDECVNGAVVTTNSPEGIRTTELTADRVQSGFSEDGFFMGADYGMVIVPNDNYVSSILGITFPQKGTYFMWVGQGDECIYTISLTINGYSFKTVTKTVNPISAEYLPKVADIPETWIAELKTKLGI